MNKKLQEFAKQAGAEFYTGFAGSPNSVKFMEEDLEKFAELLVRECVNRLELVTDEDGTFLLEQFGLE